MFLRSKKLSKIGINKIDEVVHLAARKIPRYGKRLETLVVNIETTRAAGELAGYYKSRLILPPHQMFTAVNGFAVQGKAVT